MASNAVQLPWDVPDSLAMVLQKPLLQNDIKKTLHIFGQSRSASEGVCVQGGGIEKDNLLSRK